MLGVEPEADRYAPGVSSQAPAPRVNPVVLVLLGILSVQFGAAAAKDLFSVTTPHAAAWLRLCASALLFLTFARPRLRGRTAKDWWTVSAYAVVLAAMNWSIYLSFARIPLGVAVTIEFLGPLAVAVATSRRRADLIWVGLAGLGVLLLGFQPVPLDPLGVAFALLAGAFWAGYILLAGPTGRAWEGVTGVTVASIIGAVLMTVPAVGLGLPPVTVKVAGVVLLVGLLSSVIPYGLEMIALRTMPPAVFGILMSLEPAVAGLAGFALLGERLTSLEVVAMVCVIVASVGATRSSKVVTPTDGPPAPSDSGRPAANP